MKKFKIKSKYIKRIFLSLCISLAIFSISINISKSINNKNDIIETTNLNKIEDIKDDDNLNNKYKSLFENLKTLSIVK